MAPEYVLLTPKRRNRRTGDPAAASRPGPAPRTSPLSRLRALVLLSGSVRASAWSGGLGRSVLDLPLEPGRSLLAHWLHHAMRLSGAAGSGPLAVRVLVDRWSPAPQPQPIDCVAALFTGSRGVGLQLDRDALDYRGTGGLLRDLSMGYDVDDYLLVASGAQVLTEPLKDAASRLASRSPDVALVAHDDGTPSGLLWVRCGCLRLIPEIGFVDMKEQALPRIARRFDVRVLRCDPPGMPVRTPAEYLCALRTLHMRRADDERLGDPFAEEGRPAFSLVEAGADVDETVRVHDSVVLRGARVGRHAVVVRSLVAPGGVVGQGEHVADRVIAPPRKSVGWWRHVGLAHERA